jgi:hypothetical protein
MDNVQNRDSWYFVIRLYTTRVNCIITLLSLHVSALLGHHQVTNVYNYNIKYIPIQLLHLTRVVYRRITKYQHF